MNEMKEEPKPEGSDAGEEKVDNPDPIQVLNRTSKGMQTSDSEHLGFITTFSVCCFCFATEIFSKGMRQMYGHSSQALRRLSCRTVNCLPL